MLSKVLFKQVLKSGMYLSTVTAVLSSIISEKVIYSLLLSEPLFRYVVTVAQINLYLIHAFSGLFPVLIYIFFFRFREVLVIWKDVTRLVHLNPLAVSDEPESLQFLINDNTMKQDKPELAHILTWALVPPVTAISFFSQQYLPHPLTAQYAVRVLQSYPPVSIICWSPRNFLNKILIEHEL